MIKIKNYDVLREPLITEKVTRLKEEGKYSLIVDPKSNKRDIKSAAEKIFGVEILSVNVINTPVKTKVFKGIKSVKNGVKKAIITTKGKKKIELIDG